MLNFAEIALLLREIEPWTGAVVQRVQQASPETVTLALRRPGANAWLTFVLERGNPRFHFITDRPSALSRPPAFTMALRKHLVGGRLRELEQPTNERIARLRFERTQGDVVLVAELIPPGGNLLLVDSEERVLARLFNDERNGKVGRPYRAPPQREGAPDSTVRSWTGPSFHEFLAAQYPITGSDETARAEQSRGERKRAALLEKLDEDLAKAGDPDTWRRLGDLLTAMPPGKPAATELPAVDTATGQPVRIAVDPNKTVHENAEAYFKRARRAESARLHVAARRKMVLEEPIRPAQAQSSAKKKAATTDNLPPGHVFRYPGGSLIAAGRSADENDRLTHSYARGEDYWLHARGVPGSHVIVRHSPEDELGELLDDAARIALHYSFKHGEPAGDVQATKRKYVQRIKGAPGKVRLVKEENRRVTVDADAWRRIESRKVLKPTSHKASGRP